MSFAYRGLDYAAERRFAGFEDALAAGFAQIAYERRIARTAAGVVGVAGGLLLFLATVCSIATSSSLGRDPPAPDGRYHLTAVLLGSSVASLTVYAVARLGARLHLRRLLERVLARTGDATADIARLEASSPARVFARLATKLEYKSVVFPLLGIALLLPLSLHALVALVIGDLGAFDSWICYSVVIVGHAHVVLCICGVRYSRLLQSLPVDEVRDRGRRDWGRALGFTTLAAAIPGVILLGVPPILTIITGFLFIPLMFNTLRDHVIDERAALEQVA